MGNSRWGGVPLWARSVSCLAILCGLACHDADPHNAAGGTSMAGSTSQGGAATGGSGTGSHTNGQDHVGTTVTDAAGSGGSAAGHAGADSGRGGSGAGGTSGSGGAGGGAGSAAGGTRADAGSSASGACPEMLEPVTLMGQKRCTKDSECANVPFFACRLELPSFTCGGAAPLHMCNADGDCAPGICQTDSCGGSRCAPACTSTSCLNGQRCEVGRCVFKRCDEAGANPCADGWDCAPANSSDPSGCRAQQCDAGFHCPVNRRCDSTALGADMQGCIALACTTAADCDCGSCVNGLCAPYPGACFNISPPP